MPKSSLLAHALLVVLAASEASMASGTLAAAIFSAVAAFADPLLHPVGLFLLSRSALRPLWTWLYNLPVVPWTEFNNTVVLGALVVSAVLAYPLYRVMLPLFAAYGEKIGERIRRFKVIKLLLGANIASKVAG